MGAVARDRARRWDACPGTTHLTRLTRNGGAVRAPRGAPVTCQALAGAGSKPEHRRRAKRARGTARGVHGSGHTKAPNRAREPSHHPGRVAELSHSAGLRCHGPCRTRATYGTYHAAARIRRRWTVVSRSASHGHDARDAARCASRACHRVADCIELVAIRPRCAWNRRRHIRVGAVVSLQTGSRCRGSGSTKVPRYTTVLRPIRCTLEAVVPRNAKA